MNKQLFLTVCLAALLLLAGALPALSASHLEQAVLEEMNAARTSPQAFAAHLQRHRALFEGKRYRPPGAAYFILTQEGPAAVDEAIAFLKRQRALPPLAWAEGLARSAAELARDQAQSGETGHGRGKLGMEERVSRQVEWTGSIGENISYGPNDGRDVVLQLIVDDGVPGRGHRANIFSPDFRLAGVACGPHPTLRTVCVIDFAGGATE
ncbi:MAG TPA: CAP domain-containing protein [Desulfuromonadales bacterium]|nr:CAP domain-containing protein [Desulfuromonadales bacterium]